ncbi:MAG: amino acid adenylation domain-containing protein [Bacteroidales bacterium]|nr:amino acid adenylation domain-containing protein [Bacteroidales bacterium]
MNTAPLSQSQLGVYAECVHHENEVFYNLPFLYVFDGSIDADRLCRAIEATIQAHPVFFTRIELSDEGEPLQTIDLEKEEFSLSVEQVTDLEAEKKRFIEPFQLHGGRLFHTKVMRDAEHVYWFFDMHHIISDGSSYHIVVSDVETAYNGGTLAPEEMTMQEFALTEAEMRKTPAFEEGKQWYAKNFDCGDTFTQLMPDLEIPEHSDANKLRILDTDMDRVDAFCKANGIKKSTLFTSAYSFLLAKYNNEQESLFTTVFNGRTEPKFQHSVGMTVKTLPVYAKFTEETTVLDFMKAGEEQMIGCRKHDIYSYTDIMNDLNLQTNSIFAWHGLIFDYTELMGKPMEAIQLRKHNEDVSFYMMAFYVGKKYHIRAEYSSNEYSETLIDQFMESYEAVLEGFLSQTFLRDIDICTESQRTVLDSFNQTDTKLDENATIVSMFREQVAKTPDNIAVVYKDKRYTYRELDEISDRIAAYIHSKGLHEEDVVSVLIPRCEWMPVVSMGVLKAGCAYQPLDPTYPSERLNFMMHDAAVKLLIADEPLRDIVNEYKGDVLLTKDISQLPTANSQQLIANSPKPESLFIMLYTSGTTGTPKGCQLVHRNIVAFCEWYHRRFNLTPDCKVTAYASYGFDANMMETYPCLTGGATLYIIPEELRLDLLALNEYFEKEHITHGFMTTQVAYQFATSIDNHSLRYMLTGGEKLAPLTPPTNYTLVNLYGPTESTVCITSFDVTKPMKDIPIGAALDNVKLYIVDKAGHRMPVGAAGELWVAGPQVSRGYLNRPEKTAEVYIDNPFETNEKYTHIYRTGDIVRYLPDGNIQFVGRKDGQVKIRGFRIELKEVEGVIRQFPGIKDATVQAFDEEGGGKFIAAYIVADEQIDIEALNDFIMDEKPPYMVPAVTMQIDRIPLNQNQKVNKKALPKPEKKAAEATVENNVPMNVLEQEIHSIIAKIINTEDFGVTTVLGYVGLTSIMAIKLAIQINKRFGVTLDSKSLAKTGTLQSIENEILNDMLNGQHPVQNNAVTDNSQSSIVNSQLNNAPLSYAQTGVYVDCMKDPTTTVYNIPALVRFPKDTDAKQLEKSLETIIKAHPQFYVHFDSENGEIVQIVDKNQPVVIIQSKLSEKELEKHKLEFVKPFNLRQGPLYRMEIVTTEKNVYLLTDVHHLIFDGGSFDLFLNQLCDLMNGGEIEPESISYTDFVADEKAAENTPSYTEAKDFFQERLGKVEGITEVPADLTNPLDQGSVGRAFCALDFNAMEAFCKKNNLSPSHLTLAAVFYSLSRFTNNEQICITTISNGRSDLRISNTVGMFVNTMALSAQIGDQKVMDFLKETSKNFDDTLTHEKYPFARIANDYDLSAEIMFAYQMGVIDHYIVNGQRLEIESLELDTPKFRIAFYIQEQEGVPGVLIEYDNGRYSHELMQSLAQSVCNAANAFIRQPEALLQTVSLLDANQTSLLDSFNNTEVEYDDTQTIVSLFRSQVAKTPDNQAVVYHDKKYTYREVDEISERIASYIMSKGLGEEDVVSVLIPRCEWMPIASLGVLKAGCAYQPLDPSYPAERLNFMIQDASAKMLIADEGLRSIVDEYKGEVLLTKDISQLPIANSQQPIANSLKPESLFILLYTSGSTGTPKGCQLEHGNLVAFCHWYQRYYGLTANDRVAAYASYGFDACMMDMYPALTCGTCVHIIGDDIRLNLPDLNEYFNKNDITHSFMTTQVGFQFATNVDNHSLRCFAVGGEKLAALNPPAYRMFNGYGPTECTIFTTNYELKNYEIDFPIGKPLDNLKLYIVDKQFNRLPLGAAGELWVSGPQVSRGYLNRPEKTAEVYIDNPFSDDPKHSCVYRTGDIVRYLPDGNIQFVGRKDGQVKIRGFRIELKEVEAVIRQFPGIKDATVQAFDYENGGKFIAAYIVSDDKVDIKELNAFIGKQKPSYMIPAATMQLDAIPLNQNQKVNRKALPAPVIQASDHEYVAPANDTEKLFCDIFSDILAMEKIGTTDNFFELGGTSLMVTRVIIAADKAGMHVAYGDVFANPTPRKLAALVTGVSVADNDKTDGSDYDYQPIHKMLEYNNLDMFRNNQRQSLGNVLLTGATGFLGIHILQELIDSDAKEIFCLVRDKDMDAAEHRLKLLLFYYFENTYDELFGKRIHIVVGDVTNDFTDDVKAKIDTVFNCAAIVKHFSKGTEIEDVNIGGAQRCIDFCLATGARLVHVSTYSTRGLSVDGVPSADSIFNEQKLFIGQYLGNQYIYSKFIAERLILQAAVDKGLSAKIMRVGNLAARSTDGEFQVNFVTNAFMGRIKIYNMLGCIPYELYEEQVEFSPINEVAHAIMLLSSTPKQNCLFHVYNSHSQFLGDVLSEFKNINGEFKFVEQDEYKEVLDLAMTDPEKAKNLSSLLAYQDLAHGKKVADVTLTNTYTTQVLHRLGFKWSATTWDYIDKMLEAISGLGYFD